MKFTTEMCRAHLNYISRFLFHYDFNSKYTHNFQNLNASLMASFVIYIKVAGHEA